MPSSFEGRITHCRQAGRLGYRTEVSVRPVVGGVERPAAVVLFDTGSHPALVLDDATALTWGIDPASGTPGPPVQGVSGGTAGTREVPVELRFGDDPDGVVLTAVALPPPPGRKATDPPPPPRKLLGLAAIFGRYTFRQDGDRVVFDPVPAVQSPA
jgi:hypothetical protein